MKNKQQKDAPTHKLANTFVIHKLPLRCRLLESLPPPKYLSLEQPGGKEGATSAGTEEVRHFFDLIPDSESPANDAT